MVRHRARSRAHKCSALPVWKARVQSLISLPQIPRNLRAMKFCLICALALAPALVVCAEKTPSQLAEEELPSLLTIYKNIHTHPELSTQEKETSTLVAKELKAVGCEVTDHIGKYDNPQDKGYGVVGVMKNGDGPDRPRAHRHGCAPGAGRNRPALRQHRDDEKRKGRRSPRHARLRPRRPYCDLHRRRARTREAEGRNGTARFSSSAQPAEELGTGARAMLKDGLYHAFPETELSPSAFTTMRS